MRHARLFTIATIGIWAVMLFGGFHEWTPPAHAAGYCDVTHQFPSTFALDNQPPPTTWILGISADTHNGLNVSCNQAWRVEFKPQYKSGGTWHLGVSNSLAFPGPATYYAANQYTEFYTAPQNPTGFTGYWTNGDGLLAPHPICHYQWRIHEAFFGKTFDLDDYYTPASAVTC